MLRLFFPPNLALTAPRDAVAVRVEADLTSIPPPELLPALALLQRWCGESTPPRFIQLTRAQLRDLVATLPNQPVFFWVNRPANPIPWSGDALVAVSEHLAESAVQNTAPNFKPAGLSPATTSGSHPSALRPRLPSTAPSTAITVDGSEHYLAITLPSREHANYAAALDLVKSHGFMLEPSNRKWWLRDRHKTLNFLAAQRDRLRTEFGAEFTENFEKNTTRLRSAEIVAEAVETDNGYAVTLGVRAGSADDAVLRSALAANRGYVEAGGQIFLLKKENLRRLGEAQRALAGEPAAGLTARRTQRVSAARVAEAEGILEELSPGFAPPLTWRARSSALREMSALTPAPTSSTFDALLRPYQRIGVAWLWHLWRHDLGGILADEMGLGKTLQALGLLTSIHGPAAPVPFARPMVEKPLAAGSAKAGARTLSTSLVVAPASLLENWRREAVRFAPQLRVFVHHGGQRLSSTDDLATLDLVITSYGTLSRDRELFAGREFACVIADEAQHIKNRRSQNAAALRALRTAGKLARRSAFALSNFCCRAT